MSIQQVPERGHKKSYHKWHDLEAARYFSGANEVSGHQKMMRSGGRISLDIPMMSSARNSTFQAQTHQQNQVMMEKATTKEIKHKQPHSPGGRLASFLNSIFSQTSSKKKKAKSCSAQSMKDEDHESPDVRRKRRSSISHFRSVNSTNISSSADNSSSEFTTNTPAKNSFKDFKNFLDHHKPAVLLNVSKNNCPVKSSATQKDSYHNYNTRIISTDRDNTRLDDDTFKFCTTTITNKNNVFPSEKCKIFGNRYRDHDMNQSSQRNIRNFDNEIDEGAESDSSSDLFELQNFDLGGCYSSGLPVYETTHIESIKRGAPITSGAL